MEKMFEKIISEGKKSGKSIEEINAELKAAGANFHLNPDGRRGRLDRCRDGGGLYPCRRGTQGGPAYLGYAPQNGICRD